MLPEQGRKVKTDATRGGAHHFSALCLNPALRFRVSNDETSKQRSQT